MAKKPGDPSGSFIRSGLKQEPTKTGAETKSSENTGTSTPETTSDYSVKEMPSITNLLRRKKLEVTKQASAAATPSSVPKSKPKAAQPKAERPKTEQPTIEQPPTLSLQLEQPTAADGEDPTAPMSTSQTATIPLQSSMDAAGESASTTQVPTEGINLSLDTSTAFEVETSREQTPAHPDPSAAIRVKIQPATRRGSRARAAKLAKWTPELLKSGADPLGHGLAMLFEKGATAALFLAILPPPSGSALPEFGASAAMNAGSKTSIWQGLKWDPKIVPELWNAFVQHGCVELSPPGTVTYKKSSRNVIRGAFGVGPDEWLLLIRTGPMKSCRGVLAVVSKKSLMNEIGPALAKLSESPHQQQAA